MSTKLRHRSAPAGPSHEAHNQITAAVHRSTAAGGARRAKRKAAGTSFSVVAILLLAAVLLIGTTYILIQILYIRRHADASATAAAQSSSNLRKASSSTSAAAPIIPSEKWLTSERLGNVDAGITKSDIQNLIAIGASGPMANIIGETVCSSDSPVAQLPPLSLESITSAATSSDHELSRDVAAQIIYAAIHEAQFGPAREEAKSRVEHWDLWEDRYYRPPAGTNATVTDNTDNTDNTKVGRLDFECPDAKFLVVDDRFWVGVGLGSSLRRWGNVPPFLAGLTHGRVVLYTYDEKSASFAGCERGDLQCSFMPMSPCTITREEYDSATRVSAGDVDVYLLQNNNERVVRIGKDPIKVGIRARRRSELEGALVASLERVVVELFASMAKRTEKDMALFGGAVYNVLTSREHDELRSMIETAAHLYITRPNRDMREAINEAFAESFPVDYDPTKAIGLAIRASDKCATEEKCITFGEYMGQLHQKYDLNHQYKHVVLTSEDAKIIDASRKYAQDINIPFSFVTNNRDVMQGHGWLDKVGQHKNEKVTGHLSKEAVMTSTMVAWAFQLRAGHPFLNLCSNFHILIDRAIRFGCSRAATKDIKQQEVECKMNARTLNGPVS